MGISLNHPYSICCRMFTLTSSPSKEQRSTSFGFPIICWCCLHQSNRLKTKQLILDILTGFREPMGDAFLKKQTPSYLAAKKQWKTRCHSKFQSGGIIYITQDNSVEPFRQIINDQLYLKKGIVVEIKTVKKIWIWLVHGGANCITSLCGDRNWVWNNRCLNVTCQGIQLGYGGFIMHHVHIQSGHQDEWSVAWEWVNQHR